MKNGQLITVVLMTAAIALADEPKQVPLKLDLPKPEGVTHVAKGKKVTSSDFERIIGALDVITGGNVEVYGTPETKK